MVESEACRPRYHFSPAANWANHPNGLVYYAGEYHLSQGIELFAEGGELAVNNLDIWQLKPAQFRTRL